MTRKKVKLAFIMNESARKATLKKRKKGLMKKVQELSTLCGIDACAIVYSPYEAQPDVWPNNIGSIHRVLAKFKMVPEMEQSKKMVNQDSFIRQQIAKANEQLLKQIKENREKEMIEVMYRCLTSKGSVGNLLVSDLNDLGALLDRNIEEIRARIESLKNGTQGVYALPLPLPAPPPQLAPPPSVRVDMDAIQTFSDWISDPFGRQNPGFGYDQMNDHNRNLVWPNNHFFP